MRRVPWKLIGLAGVAGVAATGVAVQRRRRAEPKVEPDELRARLHARSKNYAQFLRLLAALERAEALSARVLID